MSSAEQWVVRCPSCGEASRLSELPEGDSCPNCEATIPGDADAMTPLENVGGSLSDLFNHPDYSPSGGVDVAAEDVSKPDREVAAVTEVLTKVEKGDVIHASAGITGDLTTANFYVLSHERTPAGMDVDHRVQFVEKPREDGMTRLYITVLREEDAGESEGDHEPWAVRSVPYDLRNGMAYLHDFAGAGWMVDAEVVN